jgi:hypothetical protein
MPSQTPWTPQTQREFLALRDRFLETLSTAQKERGKRAAQPVPRGEPGWMIFERETMHAAVNDERRARGLAPVTLRDVEVVERCASGHCDYSTKFALYCAEIVFGVSPNVR